MSLFDVNENEFNAVFIRLVDRFEGSSLEPERRSCVRAENEHHGLFAFERRELKRGLAIGAAQQYLRRHIANAEPVRRAFVPPALARQSAESSLENGRQKKHSCSAQHDQASAIAV
jgi:hypothetical protein